MAKRKPKEKGKQSTQRVTTPRRSVVEGLRFQHPTYVKWLPVWRELGWLYEGDGPYADGRALVAHPREVIYSQREDGTVDYDTAIGSTEKFNRRKRLAAYENLAQVVIDTVTEHQYVRLPSRTAPKDQAAAIDDYLDWVNNDVDGNGLAMNDWLEYHQSLANLYGHLFVVLDRQGRIDKTRQILTRADEGKLVLRAYLPVDVPDWVESQDVLMAIKAIDPIERTSLFEAPFIRHAEEPTHEIVNIEYRIWDNERFKLYNSSGAVIHQETHNLGEIPVTPFYSRRRARIPFIGRSMLRDPKVFKDHYNLLSEFRELLRSNTFALLSYKMKEDETLGGAKSNLGNTLSTESVVFSYEGVDYVAPPEGPVKSYLDAIIRVEKQIYRLVNLPYEDNSRDAESAESRRIQALGLNRVLSRAADEAERFEYQIARLWFMATYGRKAGLARLEKSELRIQHPDEFFTQQISATVQDAKDTFSIHLGPRADHLTRRSAIPVIFPNLGESERKLIETDLEETETRERAQGENLHLADIAKTNREIEGGESTETETPPPNQIPPEPGEEIEEGKQGKV